MAKQRAGRSQAKKSASRKGQAAGGNRKKAQSTRTTRAAQARTRSKSAGARGAAAGNRKQSRKLSRQGNRQQNVRRVSRSAGDVFQNTIQKTNALVKEVARELRTDDMQKAYKVLRTVLQTLRDRLPIEEAVQLGAQLPALVRGFYYEGWTPSGKPVKYNRQEFLECIEDEFRNDREIDPVRATQVAMQVLERHISAGELNQVRNAFPREFRGLLSDEVSGIEDESGETRGSGSQLNQQAASSRNQVDEQKEDDSVEEEEELITSQ